MRQNLTRNDTLVLKGIAILAIVLHNFFHLLGLVRENEFAFDPARFRVFLSTVQDPGQSVQAIFAYLRTIPAMKNRVPEPMPPASAPAGQPG